MNKFLPSFVCALLLAIAAHAEDAPFVSTGKLLVGGVGLTPKLEIGGPVPDSFYGTVCEIAMGAEIQKRAAQRVHALYPDLTPHAAKIKVERSPNTFILAVRVTSKDGTYAQATTDAVMDELIAFWKNLQSERYETVIVRIQDELVRIEKNILKEENEVEEMERAKVKPAESDKGRARLKRENKRFDALVTRLQVLDEDRNLTPDVFTIIERASKAERVKAAY